MNIRAKLQNAWAEINRLHDQRDQKTKDSAECDDLRKCCEDLKIMVDRWESIASKQAGEIKALREATAGHSVENISEIIQAAPPAESLEGKKLKASNSSDYNNNWHISIFISSNHKDPEMVYRWFRDGWGLNCAKNLEDIQLVGNDCQDGPDGKSYDLMLAKVKNHGKTLWLGYWNDGIKS